MVEALETSLEAKITEAALETTLAALVALFETSLHESSSSTSAV